MESKIGISSELMEHALYSIGGSFNICRLTDDDRVISLYASNEAGRLGGRSRSEFIAITHDDMLSPIHHADRPRILSAIHHTLEDKQTHSVFFRVHHKTRGYVWLNGIITKLDGQGERDFLEVFLPVSGQFDLLMDSISRTNMAVHILDADTFELYYSNDAGFSAAASEPHDYYGQKCYEALFGRDKPCDNCMYMLKENKRKNSYIFRAPSGDKVYSLSSTFSMWNGRNVIIEFILDITRQSELEGQLKDIIGNVPCGLCLYHWKDGRLNPVVTSDYYSELLGTDAEKQMGIDSDLNFRLVHPDDLPLLKRSAVEGLTKTHKLDISYRIMPKNATKWRWLHAIANCVPLPDGSSYVYVMYTDITKQKETECDLTAARKKMDTAITHANLYYWEADLNTGDIMLGESLMLLFAGLIKENAKMSMSEFKSIFLPNYSDLFDENWQKLTKMEDGTVQFDVKSNLIENTPHWFRIRMTLLAGVTQYNVVCSSEIIDQEKSFEARLAIERKNTGSGDGSFIGYIVTDLIKDKIIDTKHFRKLKGPKREWNTLEDSNEVTEAVMPDAMQRKMFIEKRSAAYLKNLFLSGVTSLSMEYRFVPADNHIIWVLDRMNLLFDPASGELLLSEHFFDITERKLQEELMDITSDGRLFERFGIIYLRKGQITMLSSASELSSGMDARYQIWSCADLFSAYAEKRVVSEDRKMFLSNMLAENIINHMEKDNGYEFIYRTLDDDGSIHIKKNSFTHYNSENGTVLNIRTDITGLLKEQQTENIKLQSALTQAEKATKAKSEFLSNMSHDIRTPMNAIINLAGLAKDELNGACDISKIEDYIDKLQTSGTFMLGLINDILDMSRIESGKIQLRPEVYMAGEFFKYIDSVIMPLCYRKNITLSFDRSHFEDAIITDKTRFNQIFFNLLSNSVKYTGKGGHVSVLRTNISVENGIQSCDYIIKDTGIGMSEEFQKIAFNAFERADPARADAGTGLGLSITKAIVEKMGGKISILSEAGVGTTVTVSLRIPVATPEQISEAGKADMKAEGAAARPDGRKLRVLVAEDNALNMEIAVQLLATKGVTSESAFNGREALEKVMSNPAWYYDAILMDFRMPVMDGLEATKNIRALNRPDTKTLPIIAMTADAFDSDRTRARDAGMTGFVSKPISIDVIIEEIKKR